MDQSEQSQSAQGSQQQLFHTVKDIRDEFQKLQAIVFNYEETLSENGQSYEETIRRFQIVQQSIIAHSIFSSNEDLKEIDTSDLKFLLLPYYVGETFGRISDTRQKNLEFSKLYLTEFLKLCDHYELLSKSLKTTWENINTTQNYQPTREDKIASYKEHQALKNKLNKIQQIKDAAEQREVVLTELQLCIYQSLEQLRQIGQEIQILAYKKTVENDEEARQRHEKEMGKPLPKIKVWNIPKAQQENLPYLLSGANTSAEGAQHSHLCQSCLSNTTSQAKFDRAQQVWNAPKGSLPTMSLDQLADMEIEQMQKQQQVQSRMTEEQKREEERDSDNDEEFNDQKVKKERAWDDWKDENEKGGGNRMGK